LENEEQREEGKEENQVEGSFLTINNRMISAQKIVLLPHDREFHHPFRGRGRVGRGGRIIVDRI